MGDARGWAFAGAVCLWNESFLCAQREGPRHTVTVGGWYWKVQSYLATEGF